MGQGTVDCLTEFRTKAPVERRKALWTAAHVRWLAWNFNAADPNQHMFWIGRCDLDFALVGYALECMSSAEREGAIQTIGKELLALDQKWYASQTDIITAWNRVLSRLQPYAWASTLSPDGSEWLADNTVCYPFDPQSDTRSTKIRHYDLRLARSCQTARRVVVAGRGPTQLAIGWASVCLFAASTVALRTPAKNRAANVTTGNNSISRH